MNLHFECLNDVQKQVLADLKRPAEERNFYLGGGTAIALWIGHRKSVDLDWFTSNSFSPLQLAADLKEAGLQLQITSTDKGTLHCTIAEVRVSFLLYSYPMLNPPIALCDSGGRLATLDDLTCMKLDALATRGVRKDFVDLYALVKSHKTLSDLIALYKRKFDIDNPAHLLYSLCYFDDAEHSEEPVMLWNTSWNEVKREIASWVKELRI